MELASFASTGQGMRDNTRVISPILFWQGSGIGSACLCRESLADQLPLSLLTQSGGGIPGPGLAMLKLHVWCSAGVGRLSPRRCNLVRPPSPQCSRQVRPAFPGSAVSVRVGARQLENSSGPCAGSMESNEEAGTSRPCHSSSPGVPKQPTSSSPFSIFLFIVLSRDRGGWG